MAKDKRFEKIYTQGAGAIEIWVDKETGVNYLYHSSGYAGGLTVLLDKDGKPVVTLPSDKSTKIKHNEKRGLGRAEASLSLIHSCRGWRPRHPEQRHLVGATIGCPTNVDSIASLQNDRKMMNTS